jgi:hypothetical protein
MCTRYACPLFHKSFSLFNLPGVNLHDVGLSGCSFRTGKEKVFDDDLRMDGYTGILHHAALLRRIKPFRDQQFLDKLSRLTCRTGGKCTE